MFEYNLCGKWLGLLKEIAPNVTNAAVLRDAGAAAGIGQFAVIQSVASSVGIEVSNFDQTPTAKERMRILGRGAPEGAHVDNRSVLAIR